MNPIEIVRGWATPSPPRAEQTKVRSAWFEISLPNSHEIVIGVRRVKNHKDHEFTLPHTGQRIETYLRELGLSSLFAKNRVYDLTNLQHGPLRPVYTPKPQARILITGFRYGLVSHHQRAVASTTGNCPEEISHADSASRRSTHRP